MLLGLKSFRNQFDFQLRSLLKWGKKVTAADVSEADLHFQKELKEFLNLFSLHLRGPLVALDVGARNFSSGPAIDQFLESKGIEAKIHGIEIDAYRRLSNFCLRADYGEYFASQMRDGHFHAVDFLQWTEEADLIFMLNPFVSKEPLVAWGLPLRFFQPEAIFKKSFELLKNRRGILFLSSPSREEYEIALTESARAGFEITGQNVWKSQSDSVQKRDRYGAMLKVMTRRTR